MNNHKNKHIRAAVDYALEHGWRLVLAGPRAHIWGKLYCPQHDRDWLRSSRLFRRRACRNGMPRTCGGPLIAALIIGGNHELRV